MAQVDTSIYNALGTRQKSIGDYTAELDAADLRRQGMQQNALSLQMGQQKLGEYERSIQDANALRGVVSGFGDDPAQNVMKLFGAGRLTEAQAYQKSIDESRKAGAGVAKDQAETLKTQLANGLQKFEIVGQVMSGVRDQATYDLARQQLAQTFGPEIAQNMPTAYDPMVIEQNKAKAMSVKDQMAQRLQQIQQEEAMRHNRAGEGLTARGQNITARGQDLTDARGREENEIKRQEVAMGGKPPPGFRWADGGRLEAIPGGPGDKLPEAQQKQVIGTQNLSNAIKEYRDELKGFGLLDAAKPDSRAAMGTKYNNMMLQAKEAYNLGVLNGPDLEILTSVITDPRSMKGVVTSNKALDAQASELDRIMGVIGSVSATRRPQDAKPAAAPSAGAFSDAEKERRYQEWKARQK